MGKGFWTHSTPARAESRNSAFVVIDLSVHDAGTFNKLKPLLMFAFAKCGIEYTAMNPEQEFDYRTQMETESK